MGLNFGIKNYDSERNFLQGGFNPESALEILALVGVVINELFLVLNLLVKRPTKAEKNPFHYAPLELQVFV